MVSISSSQVTALGQESNQLQEAHPDSADEIAAKQDEIVTAWGNLKDKVWYINLLNNSAFFHRHYVKYLLVSVEKEGIDSISGLDTNFSAC